MRLGAKKAAKSFIYEDSKTIMERPLFGLLDFDGIFLDYNPHNPNESGPPPTHSEHVRFRPEEWKPIISGVWIDVGRCLKQLADYVTAPRRVEMYFSLRTLATLSRIYKLLTDATISLAVVTHSLYSMPWAEEYANRGTIAPKLFCAFTSGWARTFSCIITMESGSLALPMTIFRRVMAISAGDSLYIAAPLLCDPAEVPDKFEIRRIIGTVGGSGIAMLIPPTDPDFADYDLPAGGWSTISRMMAG